MRLTACLAARFVRLACRRMPQFEGAGHTCVAVQPPAMSSSWSKWALGPAFLGAAQSLANRVRTCRQRGVQSGVVKVEVQQFRERLGQVLRQGPSCKAVTGEAQVPQRFQALPCLQLACKAGTPAPDKVLQ